ncbi:DUF2189 domain-containing protein [Roseateles koreensis]|uniref:DUF2189 domain-containing protein n=1 Tax=Roseateles koreensis TaxID=2987526 RepID=A0ABT5KVX2_9BURK|nr:DUF2189 domain-containing protein [Roseateles koreensis]MDC8787091.1 DUF2189 domain-containing protein [Roseateles koreensis]
MTPHDTPAPSQPIPVSIPTPEARPADSVFDIELRPLPWSAPWRWLKAGWRDFRRAPAIGLFYGLCFTLMGWAVLRVFQTAPVYTLALSAGFLLVGPFMCLGLYQVSYRLEAGEVPGLLDSLTSWRRRISQLAIFGFVLLILEMLWARSALVVFAVSFNGMPDFAGSIAKLLDLENLGFIVAYLAVGAVFAGLIYAVCVISIPMLLHRDTDAITAGLTSLRLVLTQTGVMILWGSLITILVVLAMIPGFAGLLVVGPVLGHASWHAYREAVVDAPGA